MPNAITWRKRKSGSDVFLGALQIAAFTFTTKTDKGWTVAVRTYDKLHVADNMSAALHWFHQQIKLPPAEDITNG